MAFWLVAQQTDIVAQPCRWRLFNALVGAVYVFCYINVQPGASRHRVAVFYLVSTLGVGVAWKFSFIFIFKHRILFIYLLTRLGKKGTCNVGAK